MFNLRHLRDVQAGRMADVRTLLYLGREIEQGSEVEESVRAEIRLAMCDLFEQLRRDFGVKMDRDLVKVLSQTTITPASVQLLNVLASKLGRTQHTFEPIPVRLAAQS